MKKTNAIRACLFSLLVLPLWAANLKIVITDADTGEPLKARVRVQKGDDKPFDPYDPMITYQRASQPESNRVWVRGKSLYFYADGELNYRDVEGKVLINVEHGFEYLPVYEEIDLPKEGEIRFHAKLKRFVDMPKEGWYGVDNHVHYEVLNDPKAMNRLVNLLEAEDQPMHFGMDQYTPTNPEDKIHVQVSERVGEDQTMTIRGHQLTGAQEMRGVEYGHIGLYLANDYIKMEDHPMWPLNPDYAYRCYLDDGYMIEFHEGAAAGGLLGIYLNNALGMNMAIEVMQFRKFMTRNWYVDLTCNTYIPPSAGGDVPVGGGALGEDRTYAKVEGELTLRSWMQALKEGRTFVSCGPLLSFKVNGKDPWVKTRLKKGDKVKVEGWVESRYPPDKIEIVKNKEVIFAKEFNGKRRIEFSEEFDADASAWYALRVTGIIPGRGNQLAHSNAATVYVDDKPIQVKQGWQGASWRIGNLKNQKKKYRELTKGMKDYESRVAYYDDLFDLAVGYYERQKRIEKGKSTPPTIIAPYPTRLYDNFKQDFVPVSFSYTGHVVVEGGPHMTIQVDDTEPYAYYGNSPVFIRNLKSGEHTVTLRLVDSNGKPLENPEATAVKSFTVATGN